MEDTQTKRCNECLSEMPLEAKRCSHCGSKWKPKTPKSAKIILLSIVACALGIIGYGFVTTPITPTTPEVSPFGDYRSVVLREEAYLWIPHDEGERGEICITATKEGYHQFTEALLRNDPLGTLEIPGLYCVSSGTRVLAIDETLTLRKVRVLAGVVDADSGAIGSAGWTAKEFVVKP